MQTPPSRPFRGGAKWGEVAGNAALVVVGGGLVAVAYVAVPPEVTAIRVLAWYTAGAVLATAVLAIALALTRRLPVLHTSELAGAPALAVRSWRGEWWHTTALDAGLAVASAALLALGVRAGGGWAALGLLAAAVGAWFGGRVVLTVSGRRHPEALWLTPDEVVHDAPWGRERVRRDQVRRVRSATTSDHVLIEADAPRREPCPRPWRRALRGGTIEVDCSWTGHAAEDLAAWLAHELGTAPPGR